MVWTRFRIVNDLYRLLGILLTLAHQSSYDSYCWYHIAHITSNIFYCLIAEIYTTAVSSLYGFTARVIDIQKKPVKGRYIVAGATIVALISSGFGFSNLVKYLYPLVGYCGIIILSAIVFNIIRGKTTN